MDDESCMHAALASNGCLMLLDVPLEFDLVPLHHHAHSLPVPLADWVCKSKFT